MTRTRRLLLAGLKSRATTLLGVGGFLVLLGGYIVAWADGDPTTQPDINPIVELIAAFFFGSTAVMARDAGVSSQDSGIR